MSANIPIKCNNKRVYKVGGNISSMTGDESSSVITNNEKNSAKKIHRSFSITRNPFRWSRKYKANDDNEYVTKKDENTKCNDDKSSRSSLREGTDNNVQQITNNNNNKILRRSSFRKFLSRIAQHVTSVSIGVNKHSTSTSTNVSDRVPPIGGYQWPPDQTPGVTGLKNHGNTCFMNAVLQCLSHTDILAEYFVLDQYKADLKRRNKLNSRKFGTKGELTEQLANVLKALWTCKNESDHSTSFKAVVDRYGSQFQNSTQHDAQEFLLWLLDKVHEDLNTATKRRYKTFKNNYGRPDEVIAAETLANHIRCNNSFVQAVFQAQFRSSLTCPRCHKQSNTFDPFHCISVQLPQLSQQIIFVTVLYVTQHPRQVKLGLTVPSGSPIIVLREQLQADTGIKSNRMVLVDINENGFSRVFYDSQPLLTLDGINSIYCVEIPEMKDGTSSSELMLIIANVRKLKDGTVCRFGTPFCVQVNRDCSYVELQKKLLKEMSAVLKPEIFAYKTPLTDMFEIRLQDPSADPDTYLEQVEHPLFTEIIDMALSVLSSDAGPPHIKLLLEWENPEDFFLDLNDPIVEHESVSRLKDSTANHAPLTLEQCLEHYTKAETLSAEDAWRCPNCQQYLPVVKTLGLWSLPDILVIHFKRFRQQNGKGPDAAKLTTMVKFPLNAFDMSPHLARGSTKSNDSLNKEDSGGGGGTVSNNGGGNNSNNSNNSRLLVTGSPWRKPQREHNKYKDRELKDNRYDLYAVCYHQGETLETGHYTAACKNPYDHQWYKFDDQRVTHVPTEEVQDEIVNNEAYILFYQRRKIDSAECSGASSTSGDHWVSRIPIPSPLPQSSAINITNGGDGINDIIDNNISTTAKLAIKSSNSHENYEKSIDGKNNDENNKKTIITLENNKNYENNLTSQQQTINENNEKYNIKQQIKPITEAIFIEKTDEDEFVDVEGIEDDFINKNNENDDNDDDHKNEIISIANKLKNTHCNLTTINNNTSKMNRKVISIVEKQPLTTSSSSSSSSSLPKNTNGLHDKISIIGHPNLSLIHNKNEERNNEFNNTNLIKDIWPNKNEINNFIDDTDISNINNDSFVSTVKVDKQIKQKINIDDDNIKNKPIIYNSNSTNNIKDTITASSFSITKTTNMMMMHIDDEGDDTTASTLSVSAAAATTATTDFHNNLKLRHSFSSTSSSNYKLRDTCDTLSMLRNTNNSCSKDTLIYIDQQNHHHGLIEEDDSYLGSRSIWISPVTPHKLITVSPKN